MVQLRSRVRRWPPLERVLAWLTARFTTWPADEFARFTHSAHARLPGTATALPPQAPPIRAPAPQAISPATFELRFARLHREGGYDEMWELLAEDAQRSWGDRQSFVRRMQGQAADFELLEVDVRGMSIVPQWTDRRSLRTYRNVARLAMHYRVRQGWRESALDREVHLVPAAGGWRTLYYPAE